MLCYGVTEDVFYAGRVKREATAAAAEPASSAETAARRAAVTGRLETAAAGKSRKIPAAALGDYCGPFIRRHVLKAADLVAQRV